MGTIVLLEHRGHEHRGQVLNREFAFLHASTILLPERALLTL